MYRFKSKPAVNNSFWILALFAALTAVPPVEAKEGEIEIIIEQPGDGNEIKPQRENSETENKATNKDKSSSDDSVDAEALTASELLESKKNNQVNSEELEKKDPEQLRNAYIKNCNTRASQNNENAKVKLVKCTTRKNEIFQIYYELGIEPDVSYERGKNLPLYRHYPRMRTSICDNVDDLNDAGFVAVRVLYQYKGKIIQSNYLDLNDCYLLN